MLLHGRRRTRRPRADRAAAAHGAGRRRGAPRHASRRCTRPRPGASPCTSTRSTWRDASSSPPGSAEEPPRCSRTPRSWCATRRPGPGPGPGGASGTRPLRDVAYASLPKRERLRLHLAIADAAAGARGTLVVRGRAPRARRRASLDLDPGDRDVPERAADALAAAGDRSRRRMESRSAIDYYERALALCRARGGVGGARGAGAGRHGRGALLAGRVPGGGRACSSVPWRWARELQDDLDALARVPVPRRHRDQRGGERRQGRGAARPLARAAEAMDEPFAISADAAVRRVGALDARALRGCGAHLAARARAVADPRRSVGARCGR